MLTSDLTSLVPPQFSPWLQVRKLAPFIYHLSSIVSGDRRKKHKNVHVELGKKASLMSHFQTFKVHSVRLVGGTFKYFLKYIHPRECCCKI